MGHQRLGVLPATRDWRAVVARIAAGEDIADVAAAAGEAAETSLRRASDDATLRKAFFLLARIPLAAREADFAVALSRLGVAVSDQPSLTEIACAMVAAIDAVVVRGGHRTDLSEMATLAAGECLTSMAGRHGPSLFGDTYAADDAKAALRSLSHERQFALLAADFFGRLLRRSLDYFLSRELAVHVGANKRFTSLKDHHEFDTAMRTHCREVAFIIEEFAAGWYGKTEFETGITLEKAGGFGHVAFEKIRAELRHRHGRTLHA